MTIHVSNSHEKANRRSPREAVVLNRRFHRSSRLIKSVLALAFCLAGSLPVLGQSLAEPLKTVVPIHLDVSTGDIKVGTTNYSGANPGMHLVALKRQPNRAHLDAPDLIGQGTYTDLQSVKTFIANATLSNPDAILVINAVGSYGFALGGLATILEGFGAPSDVGKQGVIPYVFVGNGGLLAGQAVERGYSSSNLDGYLARDTNGNYKYIQIDYVRYDIGGDGGIKVGNTAYPVATAVTAYGTCDALRSNSFHLVVVSREQPSVRIYDNVYCGASSFDTLAGLLNSLDEGSLVLLSSNGKPIPGDWSFSGAHGGDPRGINLAKAVARLGGYYETIAYMGKDDTYALVGTAPPQIDTHEVRQRARESSSVYPDHPKGELHGVLARNNRGTYYGPLNADPAGVANLDLYLLLAQTPVPFPNPATSDESTAFEYISTKLCRSATCNIRNQYADTNVSVDIYFTELENMRSPDNKDCNDDANAALPFCVVRQQLLTELQYVSDIRGFHGNLNSLWLASGTTSILSMLSAHNDILATIPAQPQAPAPNLVNPIVNFFLGLAGFIPEVGPLFGLADTAFNFATSLTTDQSGNPTTSLTTTVSQLQQQAINQFEAQSTTTATQFDLIYQDWGKMQTLGTVLAEAQPGDDWYWDDQATGQILQAMDPAISASYYQSLMPSVYAIGYYIPGCYGSVGANFCNHAWNTLPLYEQPISYIAYWDTNTGCCQPFNLDETGGNKAFYMPYTYPGDPYNIYQRPSHPAYTQGHSTIMTNDGWLGISLKSTAFNAGLYQPPAESILSHLFTPRSQGGLGIYRPAFYESWPFSHVKCDVSGIYANGGTVGCVWSSAAQSIEMVQTPLTSVLIRAGVLARSGSTVSVTLKVVNNGTVRLNGIEISKVALSTLTGSGQAVVTGPALPVKIGELAPGASSEVILQLSVPAGITKLTITEEGSIDNGRPEPTRFSQGQIIFPQTIK